MKKFVALVIFIALVLCCWLLISSCREDESVSIQRVHNVISAGTERKILIAYFTHGDNAGLTPGVDASSRASIAYWNGDLTGNAGVIARIIHENVGGEILPIITREKYPESFNMTAAMALKEKIFNERPELAAHDQNLDGYNTIFLVYPVWWYRMPMPVYAFLGNNDFAGKVIYVCVSSASSGFTNELNEIRKLQPNAEVIKGISIKTADTLTSQTVINQWLDEIKASW